MRSQITWALLCIPFIACLDLSAQKTFEGEIHYSFSIEGEGGDRMQNFTPTGYLLSFKKQDFRFQMEGNEFVLSFNKGGDYLLDLKKGYTYLMNHHLKAAQYLTPTAFPDTIPILIEADTGTKVIANYTCKAYTVRKQYPGGEQVSTIWVSPDIKAPKRKKTLAKSIATGLFFPEIEGFPLEMRTLQPKTGLMVIISADQISPKKMDKNRFEIPGNFVIEEMKP